MSLVPHFNEVQSELLPTLEIVGIMGWCDLHSTRTEAHINKLTIVKHKLYLPLRKERVHKCHAVVLGVALCE